ncbi:MAG: hypothetical protein V4735_09850 [Pseudomonadota bacterium]
MAIDASTPVLSAAGGAGEPYENASESQIMALAIQAEDLRRQAIDLADKARQLAGEGALTDEALHAKTQAEQMSTIAAQVSREISSAPTTKDGRKKMPAARVAVLGSAIEHGMVAGDKEKGAITEASEEAKTHAVKKNSVLKEAAAPKAPSRAPSRPVPAPREPEPVTPRRTSALSGAAASLASWRDNAVHYVEEAGNTISHAAKKSYVYVTETATSLTAQVSAGAVSLYHATGEVVGNALTTVADAAHTVSDAVTDTAKSAVAKARRTYAAAEKIVSEKYAAAKSAASGLFARVFPSEPETADTPKTADAAPKSCMGKALAEARALPLPLCLSGLSLADTLHAQLPSLPKINFSLLQLSGLS